MAMVSMALSLPSLSPLSSSKLRRVNNRYRGMAFATAGTETEVEGVEMTKGEGDLPKVVLSHHRQGCLWSEAEIYLYGSCITSWKVRGKDLFYVRPDAVFDKSKPISGGMPICFPQFGPGAMQQHGFARNMDWSLVNSDNVEGKPVVAFELKDDPYTRSMWDFSFQALFKVVLDWRTLSTEFTVKNTDNKPFSFNCALHTYFRADVPRGASVKGLEGCKTLSKDPDPKNPIEGVEKRDTVDFPGFVDCVYLDVPNEIFIDTALMDCISIKSSNWSDAVLWNPHKQMESCYREFICVENAKIKEVTLEPEQSWTARQQFEVIRVDLSSVMD